MQTMLTIEGSNRKINALAHTWNFFVYQLKYPHSMFDLSMLRVIQPEADENIEKGDVGGEECCCSG